MLPALMAWLAKPAAATLVSAGSAAVSTYAQSRNANKMANQGTDLGKLRREAEANGFNPLTVLRATGGQGFKQNVSMGSGALASASFFNAFAGLGQNIAQAKQQEATLKNTLASTANYTAQTRALSSSAFGQVGTPTVVPNDVSSFVKAPDVRVAKLPDDTITMDEINALLQTDAAPDGTTHTFFKGQDPGEFLLNGAKIGYIKTKQWYPGHRERRDAVLRRLVSPILELPAR